MTADFKQGNNLAGALLASGNVNPTYRVQFPGIPTGGTFTLTITTGIGGTPNVQSTGAITYTTTLTAAAVQAIIQALTGMSSVTVSGSNGGPFDITIPTALGVSTVSVSAAITGGTNSSVQVVMIGASTLIYTVPGASALKVQGGWICAAGGQAGLLSVSAVPASGTQDGTHVVVANYSLTAGDTVSAQDVLSSFREAMFDAGVKFYVTCAAPITYGLSGAVSS